MTKHAMEEREREQGKSLFQVVHAIYISPRHSIPKYPRVQFHALEVVI